MSPRSKEQLINKIKIEHMIWKTEVAFDRKDVEHKAIERTDEDEKEALQHRHAHAKKLDNKMQSFYKSKVDKIDILRMKHPKLSFKVPKQKLKNKLAPKVNYSEVFYGEKNFGLKPTKSPMTRDTLFSESKSMQMSSV